MNTAGLILRFLSIVSISEIDVDPFFESIIWSRQNNNWIQSCLGYRVGTWLTPKENKRENGAFYHSMFCAFVKIIQSNKRRIPLFPWKLLVLLLGFQGDFWGNSELSASETA